MASTKFEYDFFTKKHSGLTRQLDADYPTAPPVLRLTKTGDQGKAEQNSTGRVLYSKTVQLGQTVKFSTTVKFTITRSDTFPAGDGLAFFIVPEDHDFPDTGGNLGIFRPKGTSAGVFAVALDFSIDKDHLTLAIDIGSRVPKKSTRVTNDFNEKQLTLTVSYDAKTGETTAIVTDSDGEPHQVSYQYQLSQNLPSRVSVGLAASTSEVAAVHDINYWAFASEAQ